MRILRPVHVAPARRGAMLIWAMLVSIVIASASYIFATLGRSASDMAELHARRVQANALSEAAVAEAIDAIEAAYDASGEVPESGTVVIDGLEATYTVEEAEPEQRLVNDNGMAVFRTTFRVTGTATVRGTQETFKTMVNAERVPLFQFAMFSQNDMDFLRVATMTIKGRVHSNGRILIATHNQLTFNTNYVGAAGGIYGTTLVPGSGLGKDYEGSVSPLIRKWVDDPYDATYAEKYYELLCKDALDAMGIWSTGGYDSDFDGHDDDGDGGYDGWDDLLPFSPGVVAGTSADDFYIGPGDGFTLKTGSEGLSEMVVPSIDNLAMFTETKGGDYEWDGTSDTYVEVTPGTGTHGMGVYHEQAGLSILGQPDGTWKAYDGAGLEITDKLTDAVTTSSMYDARQAEGTGEKIHVTKIEMDKLNASGYFPPNGLLYLAGYGAGTGAEALGFQLFDGKELKGDLTVVSPNSVYVQGDYNTTSSKAAAVIADAVNLLSNAWDGKKTPGSLPTASDTEYHMAVVTGDVDDVATGLYQGGPHNSLRRHENWTGKKETFVGSLVTLFRSQYATADFGLNGDFYKPPTRVWSYDEKFNSIDNLPPFTPQSISVEPLVIW